ncbi:MAG: hypothetical protein ACRCT8_12220 [Lacipirellulaceae bacterium]
MSRFVGWLQDQSDRLVDGVMRATRESLGGAVVEAETLQASIELDRLFGAAFAEAHRTDDGLFVKTQLRLANELWGPLLYAAQDLLAERVKDPGEFFGRRDVLYEPLAKLRPYWAAAAHSPGARDSRESAASRHPSGPALLAAGAEVLADPERIVAEAVAEREAGT